METRTEANQQQSIIETLEALWAPVLKQDHLTERTVYCAITATSFWFEAAFGNDLVDDECDFGSMVETFGNDTTVPIEVARAIFEIIKWRLERYFAIPDEPKSPPLKEQSAVQ